MAIITGIVGPDANGLPEQKDLAVSTLKIGTLKVNSQKGIQVNAGVTVPEPGGIVQAKADGKIDAGWLPEVTVPVMTGATLLLQGKAGAVPAPKKEDRTSFLRGDGTWTRIPQTYVLDKPIIQQLPNAVLIGDSVTIKLIQSSNIALPSTSVASYVISINKGTPVKIAATPPSTSYTFIATGPDPSTLVVQATAIDSIGNESATADSFSFLSSGYVVTPTILAPVDGSTLSGIDFTITTSDFTFVGKPDTFASMSVVIFDANTGAGLYENTEITSTTFVIPNLGVASGTTCGMIVTHTSTDNKSNTSHSISFTISNADRTGERIDNKATIIGKLGDKWIAWLDAAYRGTDIKWGKYGTDLSGLVNVGGSSYTVTEGWTADQILARDRKDTQTSKQNTDYLKTQNTGTDSQNIVGVPAAAHCFNITINGTTAQLPNVQTAAFGYANRGYIDAHDPTAEANASRKMSAMSTYWSSSEVDSNFAFHVDASGGVYSTIKSRAYAVCPVLEIDV